MILETQAEFEAARNLFTAEEAGVMKIANTPPNPDRQPFSLDECEISSHLEEKGLIYCVDSPFAGEEDYNYAQLTTLGQFLFALYQASFHP